jgi:hypothetical protein
MQVDVNIIHLRETFRCNGYSNLEKVRAFTRKQKSQTQNEKPAGIAVIRSEQAIFKKNQHALLQIQ